MVERYLEAYNELPEDKKNGNIKKDVDDNMAYFEQKF